MGESAKGYYQNAGALHVPTDRPKPLAYTSPWYDRFADEWAFYRESVDGGADYLTRHIFMHPKERRLYFNRRIVRAVFPNHARAIVDTYTAQVYKATVTRKASADGAGVLDTFWGNVDLAGHGATAFFRRVFRSAYRYGHCFVNVARYDGTTENAESLAAQLAGGMRPCGKIVVPEDLVDWQLDAASEFNWAMVRELSPETRKFNEAYGDAEYVYRRWTREGWELYEVEETEAEGPGDEAVSETVYRLIDQGTHELGEVPLYAVYVGERDDSNQPIASSPLKDVAPLVRRIANLLSLIDEQIYQHVFNLLVVPEEVWEELDQQDFSVAGALPHPKDSKDYKYLSPDVTQLQVLQSQIEAAEGSIRFLSGLGRANEQSRAAQSGLALAYQNVDKRALIQDAAHKMAELELKVANAAAKWMGNTDPQVEVTYRVELEPGEVEAALNDALKFVSLSPVGLAALENMVQATRAHLSRYVTPERLEEVIADLEERMSQTVGEVDVYQLTNAARAGLVAPTVDVVKATHVAAKMPVPDDAVAAQQAELARARQRLEAGLATQPDDEAQSSVPATGSAGNSDPETGQPQSGGTDEEA